jgi:hypothetical protein
MALIDWHWTGRDRFEKFDSSEEWVGEFRLGEFAK